MLATKMLYVMSADPNNIKVLGQLMKLSRECLATLTLLDVIDSLPRTSRMLVTSVPTGDLKDSLVNSRRQQLETLVSRIGSASVELLPRVRFGNRAKQIVCEAKAGDYDLVIKSPENGSRDRYLLKNCPCPVWLLKPDDYDEVGQLLTSHCPQLAGDDGVPPKQFNPAAGSAHRADPIARTKG